MAQKVKMTEIKRVMCVEDDSDIRLILKFSLERLGGFTLCLCSSGFEALEKVEAFAPQLVLLDVMMPKLSGPQTLEKLRKLEIMRGIPVVFLTAKAMRNEVEALLEHGSTGIIVKPFDPVTLPKDVLIYWQHGRG
jgi:CheY-like chemotaxis protein